MIEVLEPADALDLIADGLDDTAVGPFANRPLVVVAVDGSDDDSQMIERLVGALREAPVVLVGVSCGGSLAAGAAAGLDLLLCEDSDAPRPWVGCPNGVDVELAALAAAVQRSPIAAVALAQLLRLTEPLTASEAVVAESWVYSLLQAGEHHRRWLDDRSSAARRPRPDRPVVLIERAGATLRVTLDRPEVRNAYGTRVRDELVAALQLVEADPSLETVELRGSGPAFCSGGDLDEFGTAPDPAAAHVVRTTRNAGVHIARLKRRVTAFVHGPCVGAGVELPAFAHDVVARSDTTFLLPEITMGLVPGAGGTGSIPRRIGRHRTAHFALRATPLDVDTALDWGLVDRIDDDCFDEPALPRRKRSDD